MRKRRREGGRGGESRGGGRGGGREGRREGGRGLRREGKREGGRAEGLGDEGIKRLYVSDGCLVHRPFSSSVCMYPVLLMSLEMTRAPLLSAGDENCPAHKHTSRPPSTLSTKVCEE